MKKARTDIILVLVFFYLLTLELLHLGLRPTNEEVAVLVGLVALPVVVILLRVDRIDPKS